MTNQEVSIALSKAITLLTNAKSAVDNRTAAQISDPVTIKSEDGLITVGQDGKVFINPNERLIQKAATDESHFNKRYSYIAGPVGSNCPRCGGRGIIF